MSSLREDPIGDGVDESVAEYQSISLLAVGGLLAGLASAVALTSIALVFVPAVAVVLNLWALRRIAYYAPALGGRRVALVGLCLALAFGVAGVTSWFAYREAVRIQGRQVGQRWFSYLLAGEAAKAHQMVIPPHQRHPLDEDLWDVYRRFPDLRERFDNFVADPLVRTLMALGPDAQVRYYDTELVRTGGSEDALGDVYAVTYTDEGGKKRTFFVFLSLWRVQMPRSGQPQWQVLSYHGGYQPKNWPADSTADGGSAIGDERSRSSG